MVLPRIFRSSLIYLFGNMMNGIAPFLLLPVLTRFLTPEELGLVVTYQILFSIFSAVSTFGVQSAVSVQYFKAGPLGLPQLVLSCLAIILVAGLAVLAFVMMLAPLVDFTGLSRGWLFWCVVSAAASGCSAILLVIWQAAEKPLPFVIFQFGQVTLNAVLSIILVAYLERGAEGRLTGIILPALLFGCLGIALLLISGNAKGPISREHVRTALRFGLPLLPHTLATIAITQGDRLILAHQIGLSEAGIYAVAMQIMLPLTMFADALNRAFSPWIFRRLKGEREIEVAASQLGLTFAYVLAAVCYLLAISAGLGYFLGSGFATSTSYIYLILPGTVASCVYYALINPIYYAGRTELLTMVTVSGAIAYLGLGWQAAGLWGATGLALTYSGVSILQTIAVFFIAQRVHRLPLAAGRLELMRVLAFLWQQRPWVA